MTTNKPEELAWTWMYRKTRRVTTDYSRALCLSEPPYSIKIEPLIRLSDYKALQAECDALAKALEGLERVAKVVSDNSDAVCGENNQLRAECEKLRKAIRRLCNIYVVDDYYSGDMREDRLNRAVDRAIDTATGGDKP